MSRPTVVTTDVSQAASVVAAGGLVAFPTETVYGLGANAASPAAVESVFRAKARPAGHPLIVHVSSPQRAISLAATDDPRITLLADQFWPGPLTLVVPRGAEVCDEVTGGRPTLGLRMPDHPLALELLTACEPEVPGLVGPSANRFGRVSPTSAQHVLADLDGRIDLILDGGPCRVGVESTIVELVGPHPTLLRPGAIEPSELEAVLGVPVADGRSGPSRAAGMLASHYAPDARVVIVSDPDEALRLGASPSRRLIGPGAAAVGGIDLCDDAAIFAAGLYTALRALDQPGVEEIVVVPPSRGPLRDAVLDRLTKASAPR